MSYLTNGFDYKIIELLNDGAVGFMPSDTIYGLSCRAQDKRAVDRLKDLKERDGSKAFIVLINDVEMLDLLSIYKKQVEPAEKYWPGPLTLECDTHMAPVWLPKINGHFGIRIPNKPDLLELISKVGPLVSTSANRSGESPAQTADEAQRVFGKKLDFYVDQGPLQGLPSTLARINNGQLEVLRQGAVKLN